MPRIRARGEPSFWLSLVLTGVEVEVDEESEAVEEVRVEVRVEEEDEEVAVELPLVVLVMVELELALAVAEADEEVMVSDDRVVETDALLVEETELEAALEAVAALPWKVN